MPSAYFKFAVAIAVVAGHQYDRGMLKAIPFLLVLATAAFAQDSANEEAQVWNLEKAYWEYVKTNDLEKYRALWHENFLGWPFVSAAPVRKDHITDWITSNTSKGVKLQSYSIRATRHYSAISRSFWIFRAESERKGQCAPTPVRYSLVSAILSVVMVTNWQ